ncbi:hypothetical protein LC612_43805, partial [Nostoc sp. CHAB 5834]|nr:hypothetical protein [Nostoc sp. CHAB 5834]
MIIEEVNHTALVRSQGVLSTSKFDFAKNAHMFRLMSSGIYSDKITAVLREIGCNAYDAHIAAGISDVPFIVKLPTALDPEFYIQDFGPGLSNAAMFDLYTVYGMSDKQKNKEQTGAFGLGSKSPFAYTLENPDGSDGFTVESAHEGVKRVYTCYVTET